MTDSKYNLEDRTYNFSVQVISMCKKISRNIITNPLVSQLIRSSTSIGANYHEANGASSRKDFRNKIYICKKEAKETIYWLKLLNVALEQRNKDCVMLTNEADELARIFNKIGASLQPE